MKKILLLLSLLLFSVSSVSAWNPMVTTGGVSGVIPDYTQGFEETGSPSDGYWTAANGHDYDFSTAGIDMIGSECLELGPAEQVSFTHPSMADEFWVSYRLRQDEVHESTEELVYIKDASTATISSVYWRPTTSNNDFYAQANGGDTPGDTTESIAGGVSQYIKVHFVSGTANDTSVEVCVWTGAAWGAYSTSTGGTDEDSPVTFAVANKSDTEVFYFDHFIYHTADITDPRP